MPSLEFTSISLWLFSQLGWKWNWKNLHVCTKYKVLLNSETFVCFNFEMNADKCSRQGYLLPQLVQQRKVRKNNRPYLLFRDFFLRFAGLGESWGVEKLVKERLHVFGRHLEYVGVCARGVGRRKGQFVRKRWARKKWTQVEKRKERTIRYSQVAIQMLHKKGGSGCACRWVSGLAVGRMGRKSRLGKHFPADLWQVDKSSFCTSYCVRPLPRARWDGQLGLRSRERKRESLHCCQEGERKCTVMPHLAGRPEEKSWSRSIHGHLLIDT